MWGGFLIVTPVKFSGNSRWTWRLVFAVACVVGIVVITNFFSGLANFDEPEKMRRAIAKSQKKIDRLMMENKALEENIHNVETRPQAVEEFARFELGMVRPGETVVMMREP